MLHRRRVRREVVLVEALRRRRRGAVAGVVDGAGGDGEPRVVPEGGVEGAVDGAGGLDDVQRVL